MDQPEVTSAARFGGRVDSTFFFFFEFFFFFFFFFLIFFFFFFFFFSIFFLFLISDAMKDRLKRSSRASAPSSGKGTVRRAPRAAAAAAAAAAGSSSSSSSSLESGAAASNALLAQGSKGGLTAQETAVLAKQLKDYRLKLQAAEVRAKESEAKLGKLINAVKDDRAMRAKDYQAVLKEKAEAEKRANEAEVALLNVVESLKENERKQKDRYDSAIAATTKKAEAAVERANKMEEKLGKLLEMMKVATKTGKQAPELVSRVAELEAENSSQARQIDELKVALDEVQQQAKEKILEEKRKASQVGGTVEELTQTLSSALDELKATKEELERVESAKHAGGEAPSEDVKQELAKTKAKFKKALTRLKETEKRAEDAERLVQSYEEKSAKMVEMVQQNRVEMSAKVAQLEAQLAAATSSSSHQTSASVGADASVELQEKLQDALDRAEFAESKRQQMQEKINQLEEKLWATEKSLWDTEDRADETIKKLESKLLALQENVKLPEDASAGQDEAQLSEAQEKILIKVLKESKSKIKALEEKLDLQAKQAQVIQSELQRKIVELEAALAKANLGTGGGGGGDRGLEEKLHQMEARANRAEEALRAAASGIPPAPPASSDDGSAGAPPPPPPPPPGGDFVPPPPPPPGGDFAPPPPPPPPPGPGGFGGPPPPPPPPGGGPPPPPPPPGMPGAPPPPGGMAPAAPAVPEKKKMPKPSVAMKGINWQKLANRQVKGTVFEDMDETELVDQDFLPLAEVEELFATKVIVEKEKEEGDKKEKAKEIVLISGKREQNISIFLKTLKRDNDEIRDAILDMDEETLTPDILPMMIESLPTEEESTIISGWLKTNDDVDTLAKAERFFVQIADLTNLTARLKTLQFKVTFADKVTDLRPKLMKVVSAIKDCSRSARFTKFIKIVLALGNFMNGRTARGGAYGFKLSTITKLSDTKTTDNKKNLLHWIVEVLDRKDPDMLLLSDDLVAVSGAASVPFSALGSDVAMLKQGLTAMQNALTQIPKSPSDKFHAVIEPAAEQYASVCKELLDLYNQAKVDFEALANRFGEDGSKIAPEEFFGMLSDFSKQFEASKADIFKGKEVKLKVDPKRVEMLKEIQSFEPEKLKKPEKKVKKKQGALAAMDDPGAPAADESNILSSVGSLATKIARDRKERAQADIKQKRSKPQQSGKLDKMLSDLKTLDANSLLDIGL